MSVLRSPVNAFELIRSQSIAALNIEYQEYRHCGTGARHIHLSAEDRNNAFVVAFRTVPQDSSGVAHILEHTTLCGSRKFPVRDPFFMMLRRSLNTYMNAFTSSDTTAYPFASQNRKDFYNLMEVYVDAVFFPRLHELDFAQEGHRIELTEVSDRESPLVYKGVVFNEMKGAMSSPSAQLWYSLQAKLFPSTTYHYNSGGDPDVIPELTYPQLLEFHRQHYHPSNALFMTYGDLLAADHQARIEEWALQHFDANTEVPSIGDETRYCESQTFEQTYAIEPTDEIADRTHIVCGWLLGRTDDVGKVLEARLLEKVLLENSASPLTQALETTRLASAPSELCGLDDGSREAVFVVGLEGTNPDCADAVDQLIDETLISVAANGVSGETVAAMLHQMELQERDVAGSYPYGLQLMSRVMAPALHGGDPLSFLDLEPALERLRSDSQDPAFVRRLVRELLLDNPHRTRLTMRPDRDLAASQMAAEQARLAERKAAMGPEEIQAVVDASEALLERQNSVDDPNILPQFGLVDVAGELNVPAGTKQAIGKLDAYCYGAGTNGLLHQHLVVPLPLLSRSELALFPLFWSVLAEVGVAGADYLATQERQTAVGELEASVTVRGEVGDVSRVRGAFSVSGKGLLRNSDQIAALLRDTLLDARFDEHQRLVELISQERADAEASITDRGHTLAITAAARGTSPSGYLEDLWDGPAAITRLKELDAEVSKGVQIEAVSEGLTRLRDKLLTQAPTLLVVTEHSKIDEVLNRVRAPLTKLQSHGSSTGALEIESVVEVSEQAWLTNTQVNFCARVYPTVPSDHPDAPVLSVLGRLLHNGYLHRTIREQGGAYGSGASYDADSGTFRFYSYRDPRLKETLLDFERALDWVLDPSINNGLLEEAILSVIRALDHPRSPAGEAIRAFYDELFGRTPEYRRRYRERALAVSLADVRRVAEQYLRPQHASTAVVTNQGEFERSGLEFTQHRI